MQEPICDAAAVLGRLARTDTRHMAISILQLFSLLVFLYSVRMGIEFDGDREAMIFESAAAALMGLLGVAAWVDAHERFGSKPFAQLLAPAIRYASEGFPVSTRLAMDFAL